MPLVSPPLVLRVPCILLRFRPPLGPERRRRNRGCRSCLPCRQNVGEGGLLLREEQRREEGEEEGESAASRTAGGASGRQRQKRKRKRQEEAELRKAPNLLLSLPGRASSGGRTPGEGTRTPGLKWGEGKGRKSRGGEFFSLCFFSWRRRKKNATREWKKGCSDIRPPQFPLLLRSSFLSVPTHSEALEHALCLVAEIRSEAPRRAGHCRLVLFATVAALVVETEPCRELLRERRRRASSPPPVLLRRRGRRRGRSRARSVAAEPCCRLCRRSSHGVGRRRERRAARGGRKNGSVGGIYGRRRRRATAALLFEAEERGHGLLSRLFKVLLDAKGGNGALVGSWRELEVFQSVPRKLEKRARGARVVEGSGDESGGGENSLSRTSPLTLLLLTLLLSRSLPKLSLLPVAAAPFE